MAMKTENCATCGKPITRPASTFRYKHSYCDYWCSNAKARNPTPHSQLPAQTFAIADIKRFGAPQADGYARRVAWEQQRAAEWMALRGAVALQALIRAAYPAEAA